MPQIKNYKKDSIVYFRGDQRRDIFLIKEGKVLVESKGLNNENIRAILTSGEFFGLKSAIAGFNKEETVTVIEDSVIILFTVLEFENLIKTNPNIGLKILKALSSDLRAIGKEEKRLVTQNIFEDSGNEMIKMGLYFFNKKDYDTALCIWERFKTFFPNHSQIIEVNDYIEKVQEAKKTGYHPVLKK